MRRLYRFPRGFPTVFTGIRMPIDLLDEVRKFAFDHTSVCDVIRAALREYLDKYADRWPGL